MTTQTTILINKAQKLYESIDPAREFGSLSHPEKVQYKHVHRDMKRGKRISRPGYERLVDLHIDLGIALKSGEIDQILRGYFSLLRAMGLSPRSTKENIGENT